MRGPYRRHRYLYCPRNRCNLGQANLGNLLGLGCEADINFGAVLFIGVIALRSAMESREAAGRAAAVLAVVGVINLPIIKFSVNWWFTLHQPASFSLTEKPAMPAEMWLPLLVMVIGYYLFFFTAWMLRMRAEILQRESRTQWVKDWVMAP